MSERLASLPGLDTNKLFVGTFHAFCLQLLRENDKELTVVADHQRDKIIKRLFHALPPEDFREILQDVESHYQHIATGAGENVAREITPRASAYLRELDKRHGIDLSGVIPQVVFRLKNDRDLPHKTQAAIKYLFIDEFQDLNRAQFELVRLLAPKCSVFAIGDPDQAIYGFRGSNPEFFHRFISEFGAETISLTRNYRSAEKILKAAAAVIANNHSSETKHSSSLMPVNTEPGSIELYQAVSPQAEAEFIVQRIEELMGGISHFSIDSGRGSPGNSEDVRSFMDFAILYRLSQQAEYLREALERRGIPFQIVNARPFFMHRDIRPLYYWIRTAAESGQNDVETEVYLQLLRSFPGVGENTLALLENQLPLGECPDFFIRATEMKMPKAVRNRIKDVQQNLLTFRNEVAQRGLSGPATTIMQYLRVNCKTADAKRFLELAGSFGSDLQEFGAYLKKNESATVYDEKAEAVSLMTLHGAKGLEFPVVFITGMEEGIFPCRLLQGEKEDDKNYFTAPTSVHEERRLFYVGMTRAQHTLILTSAATRPIFGSYQNRPVSQFIAEIPALLYEQIAQKKPRKKKTASKQMKLF
jgi:superfamily I DNA/RNA helicase